MAAEPLVIYLPDILAAIVWPAQGRLPGDARAKLGHYLPDRGCAAARHVDGERGAKPSPPTLAGSCAHRSHPLSTFGQAQHRPVAPSM
jgi:hypothetical protein